MSADAFGQRPDTFSVSVIVTTYNRAHLVAETIEAILAQTLPPLEIIVIDDGSTDETAAIVRRYPVRYHRVANSGLNSARRTGFSLAQGTWIAFCDDDDVWTPHYLETMSRHLGGGVRFGFANFVEIRDGVWGARDKFSEAPPGYFATAGVPFYPHMLWWVPLLPSTTVIAASLLREAGGFNPDFDHSFCEDWELELRCVQHEPVAIVAEPLVGIRRHTGNMTRNYLALRLGAIRVLEVARATHPAAARYDALLRDRLADICIEVLDVAFVAGQRAQVRTLARHIPPSRRSWKQNVKRMICMAPVPGALLRRVFGPKSGRLSCEKH